MAFTRRDDNTIFDEESGQPFFAPLPSPGTQNIGPGYQPEETAQPTPQAPPPPIDAVSGVGEVQPVDVNPDDIELETPPAQPKPQPRLTPAQARAQASAQRSQLIGNDPAQFAAQGGVVQSREELAKMQGGNAQLKEAAYLTEQEGLKRQRALQSEKDAKMAGFIEQTADEYATKASAIDADARSRIASRQKRADELDKKTIDPHRGFHQMGAGSKIMWVMGLLAASQTKNSSANIGMLMSAADNMINRDIAAQKADLANQQTGLDNQEKLDAESGKLDLKGLSDWSAQRELRYKSLDRMVDARIGAMGNQAAERAGLLKVKAILGDEIIKEQGVFQSQVQGEAESAKSRAHTAYMARLNHQYKLEEQADQEARETRKADREREEKEGQLGLTTTRRGADGKLETTTGLIATDQAGNPVVGQRLRARSQADAVKAGEIMEDANHLHSDYKIMLDELSSTSNKDLAIQNLSPRFRAAATRSGRMLAKMYNKGALTEGDVKDGGKIMTGVAATLGDEGIISAVLGTLKAKGDTVGGATGVLKTHIASLENNVVQGVTKHLDARDARDFRIAFKPQQTTVEPAEGTKGYNETIADLGGGADVKDLQKPSRPPLNAEIADHFLKLRGEGAVGVEAQYKSEREAGKLPKLPERERELVETAKTEFKEATPKRIMATAQAIGRGIDKTPVSDEARFQLVMEARLALRGAQETEAAIHGKELLEQPSGRFRQGGGGPSPVKLKSGKSYSVDNYIDDLNEFLESDAYTAARKKAGLVRDVGE